MEPQLQYNSQLERWEGEDRSQWLYIWMNDATYHKHLKAYLEQQGIRDPHSAEALAAHDHCLRLSFWLDCPDPDVHLRYYGQAAIEQMKRQRKQEKKPG